MKVLLFANTDWYLYNFVQGLARDLRARGHEVVLASPAGRYSDLLVSAGFKWRDIPINRRSINPCRALYTLTRLWRLYRDERPDLVHHFTLKCVVLGSLAARLAGVRAAVNAVTGLGYTFNNDALRARLLRPVLRGVLRLVLAGGGARLIVQNPDDRRILVTSGVVGAGAVRLIRSSGVDTERFRPGVFRETVPLRVLLATRLLWDKGVAEFVDAARLLHAAGVAAEFLLAGTADDGNPSSVPQRQIDQWCSLNLIRALGHVEDMPSLLHDVDIVVLPSYGEGAPKILLEAAASGLPAVATDIAGCRVVVVDGESGLLVPPRNAPALAAALLRLVQEPLLRRQLGAAARCKAVAEFDLKIILSATREVYRELIADGLTDPRLAKVAP